MTEEREMQTAPAEQDQVTTWEQPIDREAVLKAGETLQRYKQGKINLERRIVDNEQWYKICLLYTSPSPRD